MFAGQAELRTRLRRTQALTARVYEQLHAWPELLADARERAGYELAYSEPQPLISIPIPTYHSPETLCERTLASVRAQTYGNWEAIVVGDHCTDDTEARVRALGDSRIRFVNLPVREVEPADPWEEWAVRGSVPRSTGIELAAGRWIAPLSHDDAWDSDHLATLLEATRSGRAELVYSQMRVVDAQAPDRAAFRRCGAWPPRLGDFAFQASMFHGELRFLRYDRACALASEPNDWNLARRAWEAGVRFEFVDRETATLYVYPRVRAIQEAYAARGLPPSSMASP
jgi:glycosyltransferase involved in cell wall biosynthesis